MDKVGEIAESSVRETDDDYVGLWQIATRVRRAFAPISNDEVKR